ncbi:MAG: D-cysteine desulfhydrase family protein [Chloroflexi bacterium]|nr:D-cysteine desulfhydrase family protein [Chloroflexota bacterium]
MIPRIRIATLPTPIEPLSRLSAALGGPSLWIKRDDLTGLAMGGNKVRKLEYLIAEAMAHGAQTLITLGAAQSNHCRQTAALAARFGLDCILVLSGEPDTVPEGNLLLDRLFGAEVVWTKREARETVFQEVFETAWQTGRRPYQIPLGASTPLGVLGYVTAFRELEQQAFEADWMVTASSSGGTQAGLILEARRSGWKGHVLGISIDHPRRELQEKVAGLAEKASDLLGEQLLFSSVDIEVNDGYLGKGYGVMNDADAEAIRLFARYEGILLDPVYTGRAAAGMIDLIRRGSVFKAGEKVLFWHTGGTPALFAPPYSQQFNQR